MKQKNPKPNRTEWNDFCLFFNIGKEKKMPGLSFYAYSECTMGTSQFTCRDVEDDSFENYNQCNYV